MDTVTKKLTQAQYDKIFCWHNDESPYIEDFGFKSSSHFHGKGSDEILDTFTLHNEEFEVGGGHEQQSDLSLLDNINFMAKKITELVPEIKFGQPVKRRLDNEDREFLRKYPIARDNYITEETLWSIKSINYKISIEFAWDMNMTYIKHGKKHTIGLTANGLNIPA